MTSTKSEKVMQLAIFIIMSLIVLLSYGITSAGGNLFQVYITTNHIGVDTFPKLRNLATLVLMIIMALCFLKKFQQLNYQRALMGILMLVVLILPVSIATYPFFIGCYSAISSLANIWCQLFVPSAIRATTAGITTGLAGLVAIRSTTVENRWDADLIHYTWLSGIIMVSLLLVFWLTVRLKNSKVSKERDQNTSDSLLQLIIQYPYVFISSIITGFNGGMFLYTYDMAIQALPNQSPQTYQYVICAGGILAPMIVGLIADKFGIFFVTICTGLLLTGCAFLNAGLPFMHVTIPMLYYIIAFITAGLAASIGTLGSSLNGEHVRNKGIFRSFALSKIISSIGLLLYGYIYKIFGLSFSHVSLLIGLINCILIALLIYFYKKSRVTSNQKLTGS